MNQLEKLRRENNRQDKLLSKENNTIITDMICYLKASNLCQYDIEIMRKELTGMALETQLKGDKFSAVIGEDYKAFCNNLMRNGSKKTPYKKILEAVHIFIFGIMILYIAEIIFSSANIFSSGQFLLQITSGFIVSTLVAVGMGFSVYYYLTKNSFELSKKNRKLQILFIVSFSAVWTATVLFRVFMGKAVLLTINSLYPLIFIVLLYLIVRILNDKYENSFFKE